MPEAHIIAAAQCRAARALLEWTDAQLAEAASVDIEVIKHLEARFRRPCTDDQRRIRKALEDGGVVLIGEDGGGVEPPILTGFCDRDPAAAAEVDAVLSKNARARGMVEDDRRCCVTRAAMRMPSVFRRVSAIAIRLVGDVIGTRCRVQELRNPELR